MTTARPTLVELLTPTRTSTTKPRDPKLTKRLVAAGHLTENGLSRAARIRACRDCRAFTVAGLDADQAAIEAWADPIPLSTLGEMLATIEHHATYELWPAGGRYELERRDAHRIGWYSPPAHGGHHRIDVLRAHRCDARPLSAPESAASSFTPAVARHLPPNSAPPF